MKQNTRLKRAEKALGLGPVALSELMHVKYDTYKNWKSDRHPMPPVAIRCLDLILLCNEYDMLDHVD